MTQRHCRLLVLCCMLGLNTILNKGHGHGNGLQQTPSSLTSKILKSDDEEATRTTAKVTFIIPSTLTRETLNRTIESLQNQTQSDWKAIVGVDTIVANLSSLSGVISHLVARYIVDERVTFIPISTASSNRGELKNGSGGIRNEIINSSSCKTDWVAFVDDDDTLSPYYLENLLEGQRQDPMADIFIFRMKHRKRWILPPLGHGTVAKKNYVGISFAVRRDLMVRTMPPPVVFSPSSSEDFEFLKHAQDSRACIRITDCVGYFVRTRPIEAFLNNGTCHFANASIVGE